MDGVIVCMALMDYVRENMDKRRKDNGRLDSHSPMVS